MSFGFEYGFIGKWSVLGGIVANVNIQDFDCQETKNGNGKNE